MKKPDQPATPRGANWLLSKLVDRSLVEEFRGDLEEIYRDRVATQGKFRARCMYWIDTLHLLLGFTSLKLFKHHNQTGMYKHYLTVAGRSLWRNKFFSLVNISGLTLGLAFGLLMLLWVQDEWSYDRFHVDSERIYQSLFNSLTEQGIIETSDSAPYPLYRAYREQVPGVEEVAILEHTTDRILKVDDRQFKASGAMGSFSIFRLFSFPVLEGTLGTADKEPHSIFLSESLAVRIFGPDEPSSVVGRSINLNDQLDLTVAGVYKDLPQNSSLQFDYLINFDLKVKQDPSVDKWGKWMFNVFIKRAPEADPVAIAENVRSIYQETEAYDKGETVLLQPFTDRYLHSKFSDGQPSGGRIQYVRIFFFAAVFLLMIAGINFINLATARASRRATEIGIRKVVGADRWALVGQFLAEAGLLTILSTALAIFLSYLVLPTVNQLTGKTLSLDFFQPAFWLLLLAISGLTTLFSGSYPAFILSSFRASQVLKGQLTPEIKHVSIRKGMVVLQFTLSVFLIVGTIVIQRQIHYIKNQNLGLDRENIIYLHIGPPIEEKFTAFKEELLRQPGISEVVRTSHVPVNIQSATGGFDWEGKATDSRQMFKFLFIDHADFAQMFDIEMVKGRFFQEDMKTDINGLVINEATARAMGVEDPIGMKVNLWAQEGRVIGVAKDFHINSLHEEIKPLIIVKYPDNTWSMFVRTEVGKTKEALDGLASVHKTLFPEYPLEYQFLDETYARLYTSEIQMGRLANYFALIAIFISCLGLFGLVAFTVEEKTREIGIRKILGASVSSILSLLSRDFLGLVLFALLIAVPASWYFASRWLGNFVYRISIEWWIFAAAGGIAILLALLTVGLRTVQAATGNPVDALRDVS